MHCAHAEAHLLNLALLRMQSVTCRISDVGDQCAQVARAVVQYATLPSLTLLVLQRTPLDVANVARVIGLGFAGTLVVAAAGW